MKKQDTPFWALVVSLVFGVALHWACVVEAHHNFAVWYSSGAGEQPVVSGLRKAGVTMGGKYESQQKYNRKTYVRFPLDLSRMSLPPSAPHVNRMKPHLPPKSKNLLPTILIRTKPGSNSPASLFIIIPQIFRKNVRFFSTLFAHQESIIPYLAIVKSSMAASFRSYTRVRSIW